MTEPKSFRVKVERVLRGEVCAKEGDTVYRCHNYDYGCASDDTRMLGVPHISVTHNADGSYPFFTIPTADLEPVAP